MMQDLLAIGFLVILEGLLSADNALVLAVLVKRLPKPQQKKALFYGLIGAFVLRFVGLAFAAYLVSFWFFKVIGAVYLAYLSVAHFISHRNPKPHDVKTKHLNFWHVVIVVELTDLAFAIDSILVAVALSPKLLVVYIGGMIGIIAMRMVAGAVIKVLEDYPYMEHVAYVLVGWIAIKLGFESMEHFMAEATLQMVNAWFPWVFWGGMASIIGIGFWIALKHKRKMIASSTDNSVQ
jgi:YkoY family integral membrane protein